MPPRMRGPLRILVSGWLAALIVCAAMAQGADPYERAEQLYRDGDPDAARSLLEGRLSARPGDVRALILIGRLYYYEESYDEALDRLERAVELEPDNADAYFWTGEVLIAKLMKASIFRKMGLAKRARRAYASAVEIDPGHATAREALVNYYTEAPAIAGGSKTKAREHAEAMVRIEPMRGRMLLATVYEKQKDYEEAEAQMRRRIGLDPDSPWPMFDLGLYFQRCERWSEATSAFEEAFELDDDHVASLYQIGRTAVFSGDNLERAIEALLAYLEREVGLDVPSHAWAHYRLGMVYERRADSSRARASYEAALRLDPEREDVAEALERLGR